MAHQADPFAPLSYAQVFEQIGGEDFLLDLAENIEEMSEKVRESGRKGKVTV